MPLVHYRYSNWSINPHDTDEGIANFKYVYIQLKMHYSQPAAFKALCSHQPTLTRRAIYLNLGGKGKESLWYASLVLITCIICTYREPPDCLLLRESPGAKNGLGSYVYMPASGKRWYLAVAVYA